MLKPRHLISGDKVAVVSLSSGMLGEEKYIHKLHIARERLEKDYGLQVTVMPNALKGTDHLYRHPEARAKDLMDAFRDPEIKAIFNAIGGDDTIRLLPYIDFDVIRQNPKIFTGFSDTTANHMMMYRAGLVSYYGLSLMRELAEYVEINEYTRRSMEQTLFFPCPTLDIPASAFCSHEDEKIPWSPENQNIPMPRFPNEGYEILQGSGTVSGQLLGGCTELFLMLCGTPLWPSPDEWKGKILLMETSECDMSEMELSWYLRNLQAQGILDVISGIIVGRPAFRDKYESYKAVFRKVVGFEANRPDLPILYNVNVGHAYPIALFPLGLTYEINCDQKTLRLMEPATL